jgi:hypothetical protein
MKNKHREKCNFIAMATHARKNKLCLVWDNWNDKYFCSYLNPESWCKKTDAKIYRFELIKKFI